MVPCGRKCSFWLAFLTQPWKSQPALGCFTIAPLNRLCRGEFLRKTLKKERLIKKHLFQVHWKVNLPPRIGCIRVTNASILFNDIFYPSVSHVSFSEGCWAVAHMVTFSEIVPHFERPVPAVLRVIFVSFNFFCTTAYLKKIDTLVITHHNGDVQGGKSRARPPPQEAFPSLGSHPDHCLEYVVYVFLFLRWVKQDPSCDSSKIMSFFNFQEVSFICKWGLGRFVSCWEFF